MTEDQRHKVAMLATGASVALLLLAVAVWFAGTGYIMESILGQL